jgi:transposase-like protein
MQLQLRKTSLIKQIEARYKKDLPAILRQLYVEEKYNLRQCGEILGVHPSTVYYWMLKLGMPTRQFMLPEEAKSPLL